MQEITEEEAKRLVSSGTAGFYAVWLQSLDPHPEVNVVETQGRLFRVPRTELTFEFVGFAGPEGGPQKQCHSINCKNDELTELIQKDLEVQGASVDALKRGDPLPEGGWGQYGAVRARMLECEKIRRYGRGIKWKF